MCCHRLFEMSILLQDFYKSYCSAAVSKEDCELYGDSVLLLGRQSLCYEGLYSGMFSVKLNDVSVVK